VSNKLECADIEVWWISLDLGGESSEMINALFGLLSIEERTRAEDYRFKSDQTRFVVCRALLRSVLSLYTGIAPKHIPLDYGLYGKPLINVRSNRIFFNVSHCADQAVIAVSVKAEIGVDIEELPPRQNILEIAQVLMSPRELSYLKNIPERNLKTRALLKCFTSKEAYLKGRGVGLAASLSGIDVVIDSSKPPQLLEDVDCVGSCWFLHELNLGEHYYGVLAGNAPLTRACGHKIRFRSDFDVTELDERLGNRSSLGEVLCIEEWQPFYIR
jgi:4'-phosphopantetheinyl transferase